jgi:hypothetical protein
MSAGVHLDRDRCAGRPRPLDERHARRGRRPVVEGAHQNVERRVRAKVRPSRVVPGAVRVESDGGAEIPLGRAPVEEHAERGRRPVGPAEEPDPIRLHVEPALEIAQCAPGVIRAVADRREKVPAGAHLVDAARREAVHQEGDVAEVAQVLCPEPELPLDRSRGGPETGAAVKHDEGRERSRALGAEEQAF